MAVKFILAASLFYLGVLQVKAFSTGAPPEVCADLTPQHNTEAQKGGFPYTIKASRTDIKTSGKVKVIISGKNRGETFKGFIVQARVGDIPYGTFEESDLAKTIDCHGGKKNSATHKSSDPKESVTLTWTAPPKLQGRVVFTATVARDGGTYWVAQKGAEVSVAP